MKAIRDYVEIMFQDFPKTRKAKELKLNITDAMEIKYEDLISEGKTEQEAVGIVIGQFGNIDELKEEFGLEVDENTEYLDSDEITEYMSFKRKMGKMIGIGVSLIIMGAGAVTLFSDTNLESIVTYCFLLLVTIAVLVFVMMGLENRKYEQIDSAIYRLHADDLVKYQKEYDNFQSTFNIGIGIGVVLCIFGGTSSILTENILALGDTSFAIVMFPCITLAVYLFITLGIQYNAYTILVKPEKIMEEKKLDSYGWIYGVTMPLAAMIFLFIGFYRHVWHPSWIVFPITAVITTGIVMILNHTKQK